MYSIFLYIFYCETKHNKSFSLFLFFFTGYFLGSKRIFLDFSGMIVDKTICHPKNNDFYLCAHKGIMVSSLMVLSFTFFFSFCFCAQLDVNLIQLFQGTSRPVHYHVLLDEIRFDADDLQKLVHSFCYMSVYIHIYSSCLMLGKRTKFSFHF